MTTITRPADATAWELRAAWAARKRVVVTLTDRCVIQRVEGLVDQVAVTGAFVILDGWHIPLEDVLAVHQPHYSQETRAA